MNKRLNYKLLLISLSIFFMMSCGARKVAQVSELQSEVGGEALKELHRVGKGDYTDFVKEYIRICNKFSDSNTFDDYLDDGNQYTVFIPDNDAVAAFWGSLSGNSWDRDNVLRNTMKYIILKGKMLPSDFKDRQSLQTLWTWNKSHLSVSVSGSNVTLTDMKSNRVSLGEPFEFGNVIFYPVKTFMRY